MALRPMGMNPRLFAVAVALALLAACTSDGERPRTASPDDSPADAAQTPLVATLPDDCDPWGATPREGEITFVAEDRLYASSADGATRCIDAPVSFAMAWGPRGDRLLLTAGRSLALSDTFRNRLPGDQRYTSWSRPTGTSLIYISHDFAHLLKEPSSGGSVQDISFLDEHHDVTYHPAGTHIAVSGVKSNGTYGLFLADNEGNDPQMLAAGENARYISELSFSHDGRFLYFTADHGDDHHLHSLRLISGSESNVTETVVDVRLRTIHEGPMFPHYSVSPFSRKPRVALSLGCDEGIALWEERGEPISLGMARSAPVGWLPEGTLVVQAFEGDCEGEGDLHLWRDGEAELFVESASAPAIRVAMPDPPPPPEPATEVVA